MKTGIKAGSVLLIFVTAIIPTSAYSQTSELNLLRACETQITAKFKEWRIAPVSKEVAEAARSWKEDATKVIGDFDDDGQKDIAILIQEGREPVPDYPRRLNVLRVAACLSVKPNPKLYVIEDLYCGDGIALSHKGKPYHDFETELEGKYPADGISAYSFEKAGATYVFEKNGTFRRIVDSD